MIRYATRRAINGLLLAAATLAAGSLWALAAVASIPTARWSGWILYALCVFLALYNLRKKITVLPILGTSSFWLQCHIYVGLFAIALFGMHIDFRIPNGPLEIAAAFLFVAVAASGLFGLLISRIFPRRLATRGCQVLYEQIPRRRRQLAEAANELVLGSAGSGQAAPIAEFHLHRLAPFFARSRNFWAHLVGSGRARRQLISDLQSLDRFLNDNERAILWQLRDLVCEKDDLDFYETLQSVLKRWLFVHIPLTYALLPVALAHGLVAHAYGVSHF